jgi:hypothetical protein
MRIYIKNLRDTKQGVRCDRIGAYGNPFHLNDVNDDVARDNICDAYDDFFYRVITHGYGVDEAVAIATERYNCVISPTWKHYSTPEMIEAVEELVAKAIAEDKRGVNGKLDLLCWCRPKRCHTETIREYLKYRVKMERDAKH